MTHRFLLLTLFSLSLCQVQAQTMLTGIVLNTMKEPVTSVNVLLLGQDSILLRAELTDAGGKFTLKNIAQGKYFLQISHVSFETFWQTIAVGANTAPAITLNPIQLNNLPVQLSQVTVTARRPFIEAQIDRLVVNVKNSITNAGGTVLSLLEKTPGVTVNRQNSSISMNGKDGVQVMINGKLRYMPANALMNMLEGMSTNNVTKLEILNAPPANYDAGGNAGFINIVMEQSSDQGLNGSFSLTAAAFYGSSPAASFDMNYRKGKSNFYLNASANRNQQMQNIYGNRVVYHNGTETETRVINNREAFRTLTILSAGYDLAISKNTTLGIYSSGYINHWGFDNQPSSSQSFKNGTPDSLANLLTTERNDWKHIMGNLNLQHKLSNMSGMSFNIDYLVYDNNNPTGYVLNHYNASSIFSRRQDLQSGKRTKLNILPVQFDYHKKINPKTDFETGLKWVHSHFTNNVFTAEQKGGSWNNDAEFTNNYTMTERIAAAYVSFTFTPDKKNTIKTGLRFEHTISNLGTEVQKNIVDRNYGNLFPSIHWKYQFSDKQSLNLSYNYRINRPSFDRLAPFFLFISPNTYISGNAKLQPSLAHNLKVEYGFKKYIFSLTQVFEKNTFGNFQTRIDAATNRQLIAPENLVSVNTSSFTGILPVSVTNWWFSMLSFTANYQIVKADFTGSLFTLHNSYLNIAGGQTFNLSKKYSFEISGFWQSKSLRGTLLSDPFGSLNLGIQKKFDKNNATLKFGVDDLLRTMRFRSIIQTSANDYTADFDLRFTQRIFKLTYSQNFGNNKLKGRRNRSTASDDERKRVSN